MMRTLRQLFDALTPPAALESKERVQHTLQLATAVLLVEVMRADPDIDDAERATVIALLRDRFALGSDEVERLVELAEQASRDASDYYSFTSRIDSAFPVEQKVHLIEEMWRVAYADQHLSAHENHVMRKVANLLHISHADYVAAKMRAKEAAQGS